MAHAKQAWFSHICTWTHVQTAEHQALTHIALQMYERICCHTYSWTSTWQSSVFLCSLMYEHTLTVFTYRAMIVIVSSSWMRSTYLDAAWHSATSPINLQDVHDVLAAAFGSNFDYRGVVEVWWTLPHGDIDGCCHRCARPPLIISLVSTSKPNHSVHRHRLHARFQTTIADDCVEYDNDNCDECDNDNNDIERHTSATTS